MRKKEKKNGFVSKVKKRRKRGITLLEEECFNK